eukprot:90516_1
MAQNGPKGTLSPKEIDDILDEIEIAEEKFEEIRRNSIVGTDSSKGRDDDRGVGLWVRRIWKVGSLCEVYSNSSQKWCKGIISKIFTDEEGEWIEVKYEVKSAWRCREIPRDDTEAVRPLAKAVMVYKYIFNAIRKLPEEP